MSGGTIIQKREIRRGRSWRFRKPKSKAPCTLILIRNGESEWNIANKFTGWHDAPLTPKGIDEVKTAGKLLKAEGLKPDVAYTSMLKRAISSLNHVLEEADLVWIPVTKAWQFNARHYGGLTGLDKARVAEKYGEEQVKQVMAWKRSYDIPPPTVNATSEHHPSNDTRYSNLDFSGEFTETPSTTSDRVLPYFEQNVIPDLRAGKTVILSAHEDSLRSLVKHLDGIDNNIIPNLNIPTGVPLVYQLDENMMVIPDDKAMAPLRGRYLGNHEEFKTMIADVQGQTHTTSSASTRAVESVDVGNMRTFFNEIDSDKSGYLDASELGNFIQKITGTAPAADELEYMIAEADKNSDGKVSFEEFQLIISALEYNSLANQPICAELVGEFEATTFLVIPSTGNVGHLVASALAKVPTFTVKCGIRKTSNEGIVQLVKAIEGTETIEVDHFSVDSLTAAMQGVDKVLTYSPSVAMTKWGDVIVNVKTAAKAAGVKCVYWISADNSDLNPDGICSSTYKVVLARAKQIDVPTVEIKPNNLASNLYAHRESIMKQSTMYIGYSPNVKTVITDPVDVAQLVCTVMSQPVKTHADKTYYLTGPTPVTFNEIAEQLSVSIQAEELKGRRRVANYKSLAVTYEEADTDGNGSLSITELTALLAKIDISSDKAAKVFTQADADGDKQLSLDEFVDSIGQYYDRKNGEAPAKIKLHQLSEASFSGFCAGMGVQPADIECLVSLYSDFDSGKVGLPSCVKTKDFERIVGRKPNSFEDWLKSNVGGFMASHWDVVKSHARQDLMTKASFQ